MNQTIIQAIKDKSFLELRYQGYVRLVEPHAYGRDSNGEEILRGYQTSGGSDSGQNTGWKLLKLKDAFGIVLDSRKFKIRPEYKKNDKAMMYIFEQL